MTYRLMRAGMSLQEQEETPTEAISTLYAIDELARFWDMKVQAKLFAGELLAILPALRGGL